MAAQTKLAVPASDIVSLEHLSDAELLTRTRSLVGRSNRLLAELLAHLAEVEARGIHRTRACSSLYTYLIDELRFSEDEAFRRVAAARLVRRFPARLVRVLDPLPSVPARIEPLGPALARLVPPAPTWEQFACSLNPVRHLEAGERPREWGLEDESREGCPQHTQGEARGADSTITDSTITDSSDVGNDQTHAPARVADDQSGDLAAPQRFMVQFTATEEYVRLVQEAKASCRTERCTYVDASGQRCSETQRLEFHHVLPFAVCRSHEVPNLILRCQAHNALAAEQDFGRDLIDEKRSAARHDSFSKQGP